jgi:peptide/nickel transport system permease protein
MTGNTVTHDLKQKYPATVTLAVGGATMYLLLGVVLGAFAARWRGTIADRLLVGSSLIVSSVPFYLVALLAWIYLSLQLKIFPTTGYYPITENPAKTVSWMALPWLVLGLTNCTSYARFTRGQMVETLNEDFIRTASAKGVRTNRVLFKHALRAAIVPVMTIFGLDFATLLAGTIFTEQIFGIDGIGHWGLQALSTPIDLQVVSATVLVSATLVVVANLLVDILYSFLDPRVSIA